MVTANHHEACGVCHQAPCACLTNPELEAKRASLDSALGLAEEKLKSALAARKVVPSSYEDIAQAREALAARVGSDVLKYNDDYQKESARLDQPEAQDLRAWSKDGDSATLADVAAERDALRSDLTRLTSELEQAVRERGELRRANSKLEAVAYAARLLVNKSLRRSGRTSLEELCDADLDSLHTLLNGAPANPPSVDHVCRSDDGVTCNVCQRDMSSVDPANPPSATSGDESAFSRYRRKQIAELRPWVPGDGMARISITVADSEAGSPKLGDMVARNPANHDDQWLVAAAYFRENFERCDEPHSATTAKERAGLCELHGLRTCMMCDWHEGAPVEAVASPLRVGQSVRYKQHDNVPEDMWGLRAIVHQLRPFVVRNGSGNLNATDEDCVEPVAPANPAGDAGDRTTKLLAEVRGYAMHAKAEAVQHQNKLGESSPYQLHMNLIHAVEALADALERSGGK